MRFFFNIVNLIIVSCGWDKMVNFLGFLMKYKLLDFSENFIMSFLCRLDKNFKVIEIKNIVFIVNSYKVC